MDILDIIKARRSDRHFSNKPVTAADVDQLIEAFRWAPSSNNRQPWRLIFATSDSARAAFDDALSGGNKQWAPPAAVKMIIAGSPQEQADRNGLHAWMFDAGLAVENMLIQGYTMGMTIHAMGGFDEKKLLASFAIPEPFRIATVIAAGWRGTVESLREEVRVKDEKPRTRKAPAEFVFADKFGNAR